jgi:hypothetical protein
MRDANVKSIIPIFIALLLSGCDDSAGDEYVLYRSSVVPGIEKLEIAKFDADQPGSYNQENCQLAANLFQRQPGIKVRYWCEKD